jgi:hypothetical protein
VSDYLGLWTHEAGYAQARASNRAEAADLFDGAPYRAWSEAMEAGFVDWQKTVDPDQLEM